MLYSCILQCLGSFLKGFNTYISPMWDPPSSLGLHVILAGLMVPSFEPLGLCFLHYLSMKTAFLVVIMSACRIWALMGSPYTVFHKDKVALGHCPEFLPQMISNCCPDQIMYLPVFFPNSHSNEGEVRHMYSEPPFSTWRNHSGFH